MNYSLILKEFFPLCTRADNLVICLRVGGIVYSFYGQFWLYSGHAGPRCDSGAQTHPPPPNSTACRLPWGGFQSMAGSSLSGVDSSHPKATHQSREATLPPVLVNK